MLRSSDLKLGESYIINIIGTDTTNMDVPMVVVVKRTGLKIEHMNTVTGNEAIVLYNRLLSIKLPVKIKDRGKAFCPVCGVDIHGIGRIRACPICGQALDWKNIDKEIL